MTGSHSFNSYLLDKHSACWGHSSEQDKAPALLEFTGQQETLTTQINNPHRILYTVVSAIKKNSTEKV